MKQNKENVVKILTAIRDNASELRKHQVEFTDRLLTEMIMLDTAIWLLTDKKYFDELCSIYGMEDDEK